MADGILGSIGDAAEPLGGALDWLAPQATPQGQGLSLGSLMGSIGRGATDVVREGPGAIAGGLTAALDPSSGMSARDRVLIGGMTIGAGALMAREAHQVWKSSLTPDVLTKAAPSGYAEMLQLGDRTRFTNSQLSPTGHLALQRYPGTNGRQAEVLGAFNHDGVMRGIGRWDPSDVVADTHGRAMFQRYSQMVGSSEAAQVDWARFDYGVETKIFSGPQNAQVRKLWKTLTTSPQDLSTEQAVELFGIVKAVSDATQGAGHDFSVGVVGAVDRIDVVESGVIVYTRQPEGWVDGSANDPMVRAERFKQLNHRNLAEHGKTMLRRIYEIGRAEWDRLPDERPFLPQRLEVGPEWYPTARNDVADVFGIPRTATPTKPILPQAGEMIDPKLERLYGAGVGLDPDQQLELLFPSSPVAIVPFPSAGRLKGEKIGPPDLVAEAITEDRVLTEIDPRLLRSSQPQITSPGLRHYLSDAGGTFEHGASISNKNPVVWKNPRNGQYVLLSGHHRATRALLQGENLKAVVIDGGAPARVADVDRLERAVAAVSFLSEAEDWSTNIVKAHGVMTNPKMVKALENEDFLYWIKKPSAYSGTAGKAHQKTFNQLHKHFTSNGFKVSQSDLGVVLRLSGGAETVQEIFATTLRRKQRNFYMNIWMPEAEYPVTIDRHAYDAFMGLDSGINDRPIDLSMGDGDQVYDVVADTYRSLAAELGIHPHELQAVVWEAWRILKRDEYVNAAGKTVKRRNGWAYNDPYMLPEPDGSRNIVYEALNGRGFTQIEHSANTMPAAVLEAETAGLGIAALPDGNVVYSGSLNEKGTHLRHLYPAVMGADGMPRWAPVRPTPVQSVRAVRSNLSNQGDYGESLLAGAYDRIGGHPAITPGDVIVADLPDGAKLPKGRGWKVEELGRSSVDGPEFSLERLDPEQMSPERFMDPDGSPLVTHQFVGISGARSGATPAENRAANAKLEAELKRRDYHPVRAQGRYTTNDGEISEEASFFAWGMPAEEARELGEMFGQESVLVPQGLLYTDGSETFRPHQGLTFGQAPEGSDRTLIQIGDAEVTFSYDFDWGSDPLPYQPGELAGRVTRSGRRVAVKLPKGSSQSIAEVAAEIESKAPVRNLSLYSDSPELEGWERVSESLYSDGIESYSVRSLSAPVTSPNAGFVFVRSSAGLPDAPPAVEVKLTDPDRYRSGKSLVADSEEDLIPVLESRAMLFEAGEQVDDLVVAGKRYKFPKPVDPVKGQTVLTKNGLVVPRLRRDSPLVDEFGFEADFGFEFDPRYRVGNKVEVLDERTVAAIRKSTELTMDRYGDAIRRFRVSRITVSPSGMPHAYALMEWKPNGAIVLSKEWWSDIPQMMKALAEERADGHLARAAAPTPESILVHEFGHVVHGATQLIEGWGKTSRFEKELAKLIKREYGSHWAKVAKLDLSRTAGIEISELVAESFSEVLTGNPSKLARLVVDYTDEYLAEALKYRKVVGL